MACSVFYGWRDMPSDLSQRIAADVRRAAEDRGLASRLANVGLVVTAGTADELASAMADQQAQVNEIAKVLGLRRLGPEGGR
jgi:tripartite-type tricarboxylate transporter receptor subunit TctC